MNIIPAIDILGGACVRLTKGEFGTEKNYSPDPFKIAQDFVGQGATMLHLVDLDGAKSGQPVHRELIIAIAKSVNVPVQVGGGIRDLETARAYLDNGVRKIIVGTKVIDDPEFLPSLLQEFTKDRIIVAVEVKNGRIAKNSWQNTIEIDYVDFAKELLKRGISEILFTDVDKDGSLTEPNFDAIQELIDLECDIVASGGISDLEAVKKLKKMGARGVIIGKALYENKISLKDALQVGKPVSNLTKRIIPCLDVRNGKVVKGLRFQEHNIVGDIVDLARQYSKEGADELVFYDITASTEDRTISLDWVRKVAEVITIPFSVAGGIRSVEDARNILRSGADKISINSPALEKPDLINQLVEALGSQCIVVGIDSFKESEEYFVKQYTGNPQKMKSTPWCTLAWAEEAERRGAGEIVLNCMNNDGTKLGYDLKQLRALARTVDIPVVASGGAGTIDDFVQVFTETNVDAALAASIFHNNTISIQDLKNKLQQTGIPVRL